MDYKKKITELFDSYKCKYKYIDLKCVPVYDDENNLCAYMVPINYDYENNMPNVVEYISKWRVQNPSISTGTFEVTDERTKIWLDNLVLDRWDRLLFLLRDLDGSYIGHLGFSSVDVINKNAEVDSVLRGDREAMPGIMTFAMRSLIRFGTNVMALDEIILNVFDDNKHAIMFYEKLGFNEVSKIPLYEVKMEDEVKLEIAPEDYKGEIKKNYILMKLKEDIFRSYI